MSEPTATQLIEHFRAQARKFEALAQAIEQAANEYHKGSGASMSVNMTGRVVAKATVVPGEPTVEKLRQYLQAKKARVNDLAQRFATSEAVIRQRVAQPDSGIVMGERGWLKLYQQSQTPSEERPSPSEEHNGTFSLRTESK